MSQHPNDKGNLMSVKLTEGGVDDRSVVHQITADMHGFSFAGKNTSVENFFFVCSLKD